MTPPLVSILIPCYNYARYLPTAIDSALAQTHPNLEVIVVDDGSTDNTPSVATVYAEHVRWFRNENQGLARTLNFALAQARGEYYVPLDADNALETDYVARTLQCLQRCGDPLVAYVYTARRLFGAREGVLAAPPYDVERLKTRNYIDLGALIRSDIGRRAGYDPDPVRSLVPDYDFWLALAELGLKGAPLDEPLVRYRIHAENMSANQSRTYRQLDIARAMLSRYAAIYGPDDVRRTLQAARNSVQVAVVKNRHPDRPLPARLSDLRALLCARPAPGHLWTQLRYTLTPRHYGQRIESTSNPFPVEAASSRFSSTRQDAASTKQS